MSSKAIKKAIKVPPNFQAVNKAIDDFFDLSESEKRILGFESREYITEKYDDQVWKSLYTNLFLE
jgi:hypothetical protein